MALAIPEGFSVREPRLEEAEEVARLINACEIGDTGAPITSAVSLTHEWTEPGHDTNSFLRVVETEGGVPAGFLNFYGRHPFTELEAWACVHPDFAGRGIGTSLLALAERRASECAAEVPAGGKSLLRSWIWKANTDALSLHEQRGYTHVRGLFHMLIEMQEPPPSSVVPAGVSVRTFAPGLDDRAAWQADTEAFRDHWGHHDHSFEEWEHYVVKDERLDPSLFFLACDGDEIAGLTLGRLGMPEDPEMVWVDDMAVRRPWRRRGIALALLHTLFGECYRRGVRRIGLDVDAQNYTGAVQLYEKAGMHVYREAVGYEKRIR